MTNLKYIERHKYQFINNQIAYTFTKHQRISTDEYIIQDFNKFQIRKVKDIYIK